MNQLNGSDHTPEILKAPVAVARSGGHYLSVAMRTIEAGQFIYKLEGRVFDFPNRYSVQIGENEHIDMDGEASMENTMDVYPYRFTNHSCEPNMLLRDGAFYAAKEIHRGEELTFNYNTTEYDMAEPFSCSCGSVFCCGVIRGFKHLSLDEARRLSPLLPDYFKALIDPRIAEFSEAKTVSG